MARSDVQRIETLREAIALLTHSTNYQWGHMGCCNCGFLAQVVTRRSAREIHAAAMAGHGDWSEQLNDYCPTSGYPMDQLISILLDAGFTREELILLERLADPIILSLLPDGRSLRYNLKEDVLAYFQAWVALLEEDWAAQQPTPVLSRELSPGKAEQETILEHIVLVNEPEPLFASLNTAQP